MDLLRIAPAEPESLILQQTVEGAAPDLVKALDPDNEKWTPANARWHAVSEFVKADLRLDVQSALRVSTAQVAKVTAHEYAMRASDSDMDAISTFLTTPDGTRYVELQNEIRPLLYSALDSLQAQEPMPEDAPSEVTLHRRKQLLSMALEARVVKDGDGPSTSELRAGSATVLENAARREGATVDSESAGIVASRRLRPFHHLHSCPGSFRLEQLPGGFSPTGKRRLSTAHTRSRHLRTAAFG